MPSSSADRNLLFGILALQMDFISRDALVAAMHAWVMDKTKPLGQILREQGHLAEDEFALLEGLVRKHLEKHGNDPQQSLAAVSSIRSVRDDLQALADADVQASLAHVAAASPPEDDPYATDAHVGAGTLPPHARFHILRPHAKGGLGEVFVAQDVELKREVALKEIQERYADHPESRARFLLEAEVTGHLEHPGIVPVYGLGTYADGRPFYAMRFIKGDSLKDAIADFHADEKKGRSESEQSLALRGLLGRFVDVCQAIAYAHSRGVLHRDLKPGNIMLGKYGETLVVDWGLAKMLGKSDVEASESALVGSGDSGLTQAGRALGTPAFMSPEQAAGKLDELGPASDVYSLGATLYCLLTGQAPFTQGDVGAVLNKVQRGDFPPPRQVNPRVPAALESVCRKAMALRSADRYPSPRELASEIEHWLADEPVAAHREPLPARAARAARKRPALTAGIGALLVTGVIALGVSTLLVGKAQRDTSNALRNLEVEQRQRVLAQLDSLADAAPGAVPSILDNLAQNRDEIRSELRQRYEAENDSAKKARLALALLPDEPDTVRAELVEVLLKSKDPAEAVLVRDVLKRHAGDLSAGLWPKVGDGTGEGFRVLVALAAFDPANERWKKLAPTVVEELLGKDSLHLGMWVSALEPVSAVLYEPLGKVFRDSTPERAAARGASAEVLKLYLAKRPDAPTLFDLLLDSDAKQHALLRPLLDAHREKAIERMNAELDRQPDYWKDSPLDAKWKTPDAAIVGEIEKAGGIVAERWALCQMLPMDRLAAVTEAMRSAGYRPVSVRPTPLTPQPPLPLRGEGEQDKLPSPPGGRGVGGEGVALVWTRDGRDSKLESALTVDALKERDTHWQKSGLIVADVAAYSTKDGVRHLGLWRKGDKGEKAVLYADVAEEKHQAEVGVFRADGFVAARVQSILVEGAARYSGVWWKGAAKVEGNLRWGNDEGLYAGHVADGEQLVLDVHLGPASPRRPLRQTWLADLKRTRADAAKQPTAPNPHFFQGVALWNLGRDAEAKEAFDEYHTRSKAYFGHRYLALIHARAGEAKEARQALSAFVKISTDRSVNLTMKALVEVYLGQADTGLKSLDEAIEASPQDADLLFGAAGVYSRASELAQARRLAWLAGLAGSPSLGALAMQPSADASGTRSARAVELLRKAHAAGYRDYSALQTEANLEPIRSSSGYSDLLRQAGLNRVYASVWRDDATKQAESLQGLSADAHLAKCRELAANGYRPVALSLVSLEGEKAPRAASVWHRPIDLLGKETLASRQATAAALLLSLKQPERVWPLFRHSAEPSRRSYLVWRAGERGSDPGQLIERLKVEKDDSARRALILALGEYDGKQLPVEVREPLVKTLLAWYRDDPDPGVHSAISWLLRHENEGPTPRLLDWGQAKALDAIDKELRGEKNARRRAGGVSPLSASTGAGWYINGQGQTMVMVRGPLEFRMGSPLWEPDRVAVNERPHIRRIPRSYSIASTSVTVEQWKRFLKDRPDVPKTFLTRYSPEDGGPIIQVSWYAAAEYCNWLSEQEGILKDQWCYPEKIESGMRMMPGYLNRTGYRLPTEAEMEYACKSGSEESRYFGSSLSLLPRYAHFLSNSKDRTRPVGQKRPNDMGLFDAHGNVWNWCQDKALLYPPRRSAMPTLDLSDMSTIDESSSRALRGGSFSIHAPYVRASNRYNVRPDLRFNNSGLRVSRTYP